MLLRPLLKQKQGGGIHNSQMSITIRVILKSMNHPQPPTTISTDNATSAGFVYKIINENK